METTKALEVGKKAVTKLGARGAEMLQAVATLVIDSAETMQYAVGVLARVKGAQKELQEQKGTILDPLNEAVKAVRALFAPAESTLTQAEAGIKQKMVAWDSLLRRREEEAQAKVAAQVEAGRVKPEVGLARMEAIAAPPKRVVVAPSSPGGVAWAVTYREVKKVAWDDAKLPREYLMPDAVKIRQAALAGVWIPGVVVTVERTPVVS